MCNKQCENSIDKKKHYKKTYDLRKENHLSIFWLKEKPNSIFRISKEQFDSFCKYDPLYIKYFFQEMKVHNVEIHIELEDLLGVKLSVGRLFEQGKRRKNR